MDMPDSCIDCRFCREIDEGIEACCEIRDDPDDSSLCRIIEDYCQRIPSWCPLKEMPEKLKSTNSLDEYEDGFVAGWNNFIEENLEK